jgi:hypothetical protein
MFGRNPTQSELAQFAPYYAGTNINETNTSTGNQAIGSYFNQQNEIANAPQKEADAIKAQIPIIQDLINQQMTGTIKNLTDPNSPQYQAFAGNMNNLGITPSSGAFQAGLGGTMGNAANDYIGKAIGSVGLPIASGYSQGMMAPFNSAMGRPDKLFDNNLDFQNFMTQMKAGQEFAQGNQPSDFEKFGIPLIGAGIGAGGSAAGGQFSKKPTWICTAMKQSGFLTEAEVSALHKHLFRAFWKRPLKFLGYILFGKLLVLLAESVRTHWGTWKPDFYDAVIAEQDPAKAVDLYEAAFWRLYQVVRQRKAERVCQ